MKLSSLRGLIRSPRRPSKVVAGETINLFVGRRTIKARDVVKVCQYLDKLDVVAGTITATTMLSRRLSKYLVKVVYFNNVDSKGHKRITLKFYSVPVHSCHRLKNENSYTLQLCLKVLNNGSKTAY